MKLTAEGIRYAAEAFLPIDAERCSFLIEKGDHEVFCVTVDRELVETLVQRFGVQVRVFPLSLLLAATKGIEQNSRSTPVRIAVDFCGLQEVILWQQSPFQWFRSQNALADAVLPATTEAKRVVVGSEDARTAIEQALSSIPRRVLNRLDFGADTTFSTREAVHGDITWRRFAQATFFTMLITILVLSRQYRKVAEQINETDQAQQEIYQFITGNAAGPVSVRKLESLKVRQTQINEQRLRWQEEYSGADRQFLSLLSGIRHSGDVSVTAIQCDHQTTTTRLRSAAQSIPGIEAAFSEAGFEAEVRSRGQISGVYESEVRTLLRKKAVP
ncbi:MAG: hypothetical protein KDA96_18970 [Planctomycetaceae bacterium]|nr:hypothetical protein [Planctomycetaceae bacterium]